MYFNLSYAFPGHNDSVQWGLTVFQKTSGDQQSLLEGRQFEGKLVFKASKRDSSKRTFQGERRKWRKNKNSGVNLISK